MNKKVQKFIIRLIAALLVLCLLIPMIAGAREPKFGTLLTIQKNWEDRWPQVSPGIREVPLYFQTDYYHIPYRRGTLASGGCGIVSLAMAATYLLDRVYTPDQIVQDFSHLSGTNVDRVNAIIAEMELPYVRLATKWSHVVQALAHRQLVILLLNSGSVLTNAQHFVVLTGITPEGRILVHDPYEPNYSQFPQGFDQGFDQSYLEPGFDGAWIFQKEPRDAAFDRMVLEAYTGLRGRSAIADIWFGDK